MTHIKNAAVLLAGLVLSAGCSEILTDYSFGTPDAGHDGGQQLTDAGEHLNDAGQPRDASQPQDADQPDDGGCAFRCDGVCTDTQTDPLHCGSCGNPCAVPENGEATCTEGGCGFTCAPGYYSSVAACEPRLPPRPIAPLSTATATSRRPTFRWELAPHNDGARIEICADRACTSVLETIDASGTSGRPAADLPSGVLFWRLYGREGSDVGSTPSPTWQVHIRARSAPVDTSWGTTLDVNGDGFADVVVGAPALWTGGVGRVYVYQGSSSGLSTLPTVLEGTSGEVFGWSVASAGDVDGDGYADLIVGELGARTRTGRAYLYRGGASGIDTSPTMLDNGDDGGEFGVTVTSAGDVDGDGYADVIIGAPFTDSGGRVYLYRGSATGLATTPSTVLNNGADGGYFGVSIASAGDVDGDGYDDIVIGAEFPDQDRSRAYLYRGSPSGIAAPPMLLHDATDALDSAIFVAGAGDVDGDGYSDIAVGIPSLARAYIYRGSGTGAVATPTMLENGTLDDSFGNAARAGDVDGDGYDDVIIGAAAASSLSGRAYLYRGGAAGIASSFTELNNGTDAGAFGASVAGAGDVDGDGYADVIVGAPAVDSHAGRAYYFRGSAAGIPTSPTTTLDGGVSGGTFGQVVASAADLRGQDTLRFAWNAAASELSRGFWALGIRGEPLLVVCPPRVAARRSPVRAFRDKPFAG